MAEPVFDYSYSSRIIEDAAKFICPSKYKYQVFKEIYFGKKVIKTIFYLSQVTGFDEKNILTATNALYHRRYIGRIKNGSRFEYTKVDDIKPFKSAIIRKCKTKKILGYHENEKIVMHFHSSSNRQFQAKEITIDDIDSFNGVKNFGSSNKITNYLEKDIKFTIKKITGEIIDFKDWPGELFDFFSTNIKINGKRVSAAFALKGRGKKGELSIAGMGKKGDQIQRLFDSHADLYILQFVGPVSNSIRKEMSSKAKLKSYEERKKIFFCIIDGNDTDRLMKAYN